MVARGRIKAALPPGDGQQERWICSGGCLGPLQGRQDGGRGCRCDGAGDDTLRRYRPPSALSAVWRPRFDMPGDSGMCPGALGGLGRLGGDNCAYAAEEHSCQNAGEQAKPAAPGQRHKWGTRAGGSSAGGKSDHWLSFGLGKAIRRRRWERHRHG